MEYNKVCVYAICKNELLYIEKWLESLLEVDYIVIYDTGSTDDTYTIIKKFANKYKDKIICELQFLNNLNFSFSEARQHALDMCPKDNNIICILNDIDLFIEKGFRNKILKIANKHPNFKQINFLDNKIEGLGWHHAEIHHRDSCYWFSSVHEYIININKDYCGEYNSDVLITHKYNKSIDQVLDRLKYLDKVNKELLLHPYNISVHWLRFYDTYCAGLIDLSKQYLTDSMQTIFKYLQRFYNGDLKDYYNGRLSNGWATWDYAIHNANYLEVNMKELYKNIKICCYAMCASEPEAFIDRWLESMKGADYITVLITKKDDPNFAYFKKKQELPEFKNKLIVEEKEIKPWRFDAARNESMKLIPDDANALICTDIDEVLIDDFWDDYKKCIFEHPNFDRIYYRYAWSHDAQGSPANVFWYDKATQAKGWKWRYPVHEELTCDRDNYNYEGAYYLDENKIYLHHYPDQTKSRSSYLKLLELRAEESPEDSYGLFYLQREYSFRQDYENAIKYASQLYTRLVINNDNSYMMKPAVCVSLGMYYNEIGLLEESEFFFRRAIKLDSEMRDSYIRLAQMLAYQGKYEEAYKVITDMDKNSKYIEDWRIQPWCWRNWKKLQILADCKCWEMKYDEAEQLFKEAYNDIVRLNDFNEAYNQKFFMDLSWLQQKLQKQIV